MNLLGQFFGRIIAGGGFTRRSRVGVPSGVFAMAVLTLHVAWSQTPTTTNSTDRSAFASESAESSWFTVDCDYAGGNIIVDRLEGDHVYVHQDLRDTSGNWFYWNFRVKGAAGRSLTIHFTDTNVIGVRGPAVSNDGGKNWRWLGAGAVRDQSFTYTCAADEKEVRFCFAMPYVQENLDAFLLAYRDHPHLHVAPLCQSQKGRDVSRLHIGRLDGDPKHRVLITCRHHCCEMMASYSLEGLMAAALADSDDGRWMAENVELLVVPIMDADGVAEGDQGKNRKPHDHNRDYSGTSLYPEVKALRELVKTWSDSRLEFALDLHDPYIRGGSAEIIYFVEGDGPTTENVRRFARILESTRQGPLPFRAADNMPFGQAWNTASNYTSGTPFSHWAGQLPNIRFASTIEIPYANVSGQAVNPDSARALGADLAAALRIFLDKP
jgi:hypothetical protein